MKRIVGASALVSLVAACGGGGSASLRPSVAGQWVGIVSQPDGSACGGSNTHAIAFTIYGGDEIGDLATMSHLGCEYVATRERIDRLSFVPSAANRPRRDCDRTIELTAIDDDSAHVVFDPAAVPSEICTGRQEGDVFRD